MQKNQISVLTHNNYSIKKNVNNAESQVLICYIHELISLRILNIILEFNLSYTLDTAIRDYIAASQLIY